MAERKPRETIYTAQFGILEEPEIAGRVRAWAEIRRVSLAAILREILREGLSRREAVWRREVAAAGIVDPRVDFNTGKLAADYLAEHVAQSTK